MGKGSKFNHLPKPRQTSAGKAALSTATNSYQKALSLYQQGLTERSLTLCEQILKTKPQDFDTLHLLGIISLQMNRPDRSVALLSSAIEINPANAYVFNNRGNAFRTLEQYVAALSDYDRAIALDPNFAAAHHNRGVILAMLRRYESSLASYDQALALNPRFADTFFNRGIVLQILKRYQAALTDYDNAIRINPHYGVYNNRGNVLQELKQFREAIASYDKAIALNASYAEAYNNRGNALWQLNQYETAIHSYEKAIELKPNYDFLFGTLMRAKLQICDWRQMDEQIQALVQKIERNEKASPPFPLLVVTNSAALQKKAAEIYVRSKYPIPENTTGTKYQRHSRIRIGYFSADFREHAVSYLMAELFEIQDRANFELIAFSYGNNKQDAMRIRLEQAFDRFIDVQNQSDEAIAELARSLEIDIAVDLGGYTHNNRVGVFALRAAPIQVSYLGYLGTLGAGFMDYLFADSVIVPEQMTQHYSEKIAFLPSYQVNDNQRTIANKIFTRQELGLPEHAFVYCCFNNNYKILPDTFSSWMRILNRVSQSVLFLHAENDQVILHLKREAEARGIAPERIVFGGRLPRPEYLARFRTADLFLDTFPYNAGTTASDALWAGLPVLTCMGESFASRIAASLLTAINLPELITDHPSDFENAAVAFATEPAKLQALKAKLAQHRLTTPLFDTRLFSRNIENAYRAMYERYHTGLAPDHIFV